MAYRKFAGNKSRDQVKAQCKAQGVKFDESAFRGGSDFTVLSKGGCTVLWSSFNGRFFGTTPDGIEFASEDKRDGTPWFDALLDFFYVAKPNT